MRHVVLVLTLLGCAPVMAGTVTDLFISEYVEGTSNTKAIEIYNGTGATVDLSAYRIVMHFGNTTNSLPVNLVGTIAPNDVHVLAHSSSGLPADQTSGGGWFNGNDAIVLWKGGTIIDSIGSRAFPAPDVEWGGGTTSTADNTLRRKPSVCGGDRNPDDFFDPAIEWIGYVTNDTFGLGTHVADCTAAPPPQASEIFDIQGSADTSPMTGTRVETRGNVVTAVGPRGFFMQTPVSRADVSDATSNGIYVFTDRHTIYEPGDLVDVIGTVQEFNGLTEIVQPEVKFAGLTTTPAPVVLAPGFSAFEQLEGMLVRIENGVAASGTKEHGEAFVVAGSTRPFREPGLGWDGNPEVIEIDTDELGGARAEIVGGATIELAEGPLGFAFGEYEIWPTRLELTNPTYPRAVRARSAAEVTIATQNLHNFTGGDDAIVAAASRHIRENLRAPDILAVQEVFTLAALQTLADRIRTDDATISYAAYLIEGNDPRGIDIGFLVREPWRADSVEAFEHDAQWTPPGSTGQQKLHDRPPLVLRASKDDVQLTVIAVHLKSLIGIENEGTREKRHHQALNLSRYIQTLQTGNPAIRLIVIGDFNAFEFSDGYFDVIGQLTGAPDATPAMIAATDEINPDLTNLADRIPPADRYSYFFEGSLQAFDHALTSSALTPFVTAAQYARAFVDAADSMNPLSDHDGLVVYVNETHRRRHAVRH